MVIDEGHFEGVSLEGTTWVALFAWPGPIHEGNSEALVNRVRGPNVEFSFESAIGTVT